MMAQHTGERPYKCTNCEYSSVHQFQLEKHWNTHHTGAVTHCTYCPFTTNEIEALYKHCGQTHAGQKPHVCPECGRRLVSLSSLELHIFEKHSSIDPEHKCPHCAYKTVVSENLKNHLEALHKCCECEFWSDSLREVRRHKKKEHRIMSKATQVSIKQKKVKKIKTRNKDCVDKTTSLPKKRKLKLPVVPADIKSDNEKPQSETNKHPVIISPGPLPAAGVP